MPKRNTIRRKNKSLSFINILNNTRKRNHKKGRHNLKQSFKNKQFNLNRTLKKWLAQTRGGVQTKRTFNDMSNGFNDMDANNLDMPSKKRPLLNAVPVPATPIPVPAMDESLNPTSPIAMDEDNNLSPTSGTVNTLPKSIDDMKQLDAEMGYENISSPSEPTSEQSSEPISTPSISPELIPIGSLNSLTPTSPDTLPPSMRPSVPDKTAPVLGETVPDIYNPDESGNIHLNYSSQSDENDKENIEAPINTTPVSLADSNDSNDDVFPELKTDETDNVPTLTEKEPMEQKEPKNEPEDEMDALTTNMNKIDMNKMDIDEAEGPDFSELGKMEDEILANPEIATDFSNLVKKILLYVKPELSSQSSSTIQKGPEALQNAIQKL